MILGRQTKYLFCETFRNTGARDMGFGGSANKPQIF